MSTFTHERDCSGFAPAVIYGNGCLQHSQPSENCVPFFKPLLAPKIRKYALAAAAAGAVFALFTLVGVGAGVGPFAGSFGSGDSVLEHRYGAAANLEVSDDAGQPRRLKSQRDAVSAAAVGTTPNRGGPEGPPLEETPPGTLPTVPGVPQGPRGEAGPQSGPVPGAPALPSTATPEVPLPETPPVEEPALPLPELPPLPPLPPLPALPPVPALPAVPSVTVPELAPGVLP